MLEFIIKCQKLSVIINLSYPDKTDYFLDKYVRKINWTAFFKNLDKHRNINLFIKKKFKIQYFRNEYLHLAAEKGYLKVFKILLEKGVDIHFQEDCVLRSAIFNRYLQVVKILLEHGANVNANNGWPLACASQNGYLKIIRLLLQKGADVLANNYHLTEYCPLLHAVSNEDQKATSILLHHGADIHTGWDYPLIFASTWGFTGIVKLLLEHGADVHGQNDKALREARNMDQFEIVKRLLNKGAKFPNKDYSLIWKIIKKISDLSKFLQISSFRNY